MAAVGDIQMGAIVPADPAAGPLAAAVGVLSSAGLALGNLEGPLTERTPSKCRRGSPLCFAFTTPPHAADHLAWVGLDVLSLANNHALDAGEEGREETVRALESSGLRHAGAFSETSLWVATRGGRGRSRKVAVLGFATAPHSPDLRDPNQVRELVRRAKDRNELVIVFFHGGAEGPEATRLPEGRELYLGEDRGDLRAFARWAIDAGADLVIGSGPHVMRGIETYRGRLIAYSLGNFAGGGRLSARGVRANTGVLHVCLDGADGRLLVGRWNAFRLDEAGVPRPDPARASVALLRELTIRDFGLGGIRVDDDGTLRADDAPAEAAARCGVLPQGV